MGEAKRRTEANISALQQRAQHIMDNIPARLKFFMDRRPKCETCPHWLAPIPPANIGSCGEGPGTVVVTIQMVRAPLGGGVQQVQQLQTHLPNKPRKGFCGRHPDFLQWYSANREVFQEIAREDNEAAAKAEAAPVAGSA